MILIRNETMKLFTAEQKFAEFLTAKRLEYTSERKEIIKAVLSFEGHFTVEDLFERLNEQDRCVSRATIYRAIPLLVQSGVIIEALYRQGRTSYENIYNKEHHDHLVCIRCGKIIEFHSGEMERIQKEVCKQHKFMSIRHRIEIRGYCADCCDGEKTKGEAKVAKE